jgi:hypothetical protein
MTSVIRDDQRSQFLDRITVEDSHLEITLFLSRFDLCILFTPPPEITLLITIFDLCILFAPPHELMLLIFAYYLTFFAN